MNTDTIENSNLLNLPLSDKDIFKKIIQSISDTDNTSDPFKNEICSLNISNSGPILYYCDDENNIHMNTYKRFIISLIISREDSISLPFGDPNLQNQKKDLTFLFSESTKETIKSVHFITDRGLLVHTHSGKLYVVAKNGSKYEILLLEENIACIFRYSLNYINVFYQISRDGSIYVWDCDRISSSFPMRDKRKKPEESEFSQRRGTVKMLIETPYNVVFSITNEIFREKEIIVKMDKKNRCELYKKFHYDIDIKQILVIQEYIFLLDFEGNVYITLITKTRNGKIKIDDLVKLTHDCGPIEKLYKPPERYNSKISPLQSKLTLPIFDYFFPYLFLITKQGELCEITDKSYVESFWELSMDKKRKRHMSTRHRTRKHQKFMENKGAVINDSRISYNLKLKDLHQIHKIWVDRRGAFIFVVTKENDTLAITVSPTSTSKLKIVKIQNMKIERCPLPSKQKSAKK